MATKTTKQGKAVLVTTAHRGVFFGYLKGTPTKERVTLTTARNCVQWTQHERGVFGLAATGPSKGCRIGPAVPELELLDITAVAQVTDEARAAWEAAPWA